MEIAEFLEMLQRKGKSEKVMQLATAVVTSFLEEQERNGGKPDFLGYYLQKYVAGNPDAVNQIVILFCYHEFIGAKEHCTSLITMLGTLGVIENQKKRLQELYGEELAEAVFAEVKFPEPGSPLTAYPKAVSSYLESMKKYLSIEQCRKALAGNHHEVNVKHFDADKELFRKEKDLSVFLANKHQRLVDELQHHADTGELWYEQYITPAVVDYVRENQVVQTGILEDGKIIVQKIPYNPSAWLQEKDPQKKRYHACHCPFVRNSILQGNEPSSLWCYCSGGYTSLFFNYLLETELEVELLKSVLDEADCCLFAINLPKSDKR